MPDPQLDELDVLLMQVEQLLARIDEIEEVMVRRGICVNCFRDLKDCQCEAIHGKTPEIQPEIPA